MDTVEIDLSSLTLYDVLRIALRQGGMTEAELAEATGIPYENLHRAFSADANYWPGLPNIPRICQALGNTLIIDWLACRARASFLDPKASPLDESALMDRLAGRYEEGGQLAARIRASLADGCLDRKERRAIVREARDVAIVALEMIAGLSDAAHEGRP